MLKERRVRRTIFVVAGILLNLIGIVWFLQGINVLPGSFMTGQLFWAFAGAIAAIAGDVLVVWGLKRPAKP